MMSASSWHVVCCRALPMRPSVIVDAIGGAEFAVLADVLF
jgi:hypothetical protein